MKRILNKVSVLALGCVMAMMATACHTGSDDEGATTKVSPTVKNSIRGTILDQDGAVLTGATVKINNKNVVVKGNTFESTGLNNGNYKIEVTLKGYKGAEETVALATSTQVINDETVVVGQDVEEVFYLIKEVKKTVQIGASGDSETITIETSTQDDGTGNIVGNTQDPTDATLNSEIVVTATVPGLSADEVKVVEDQLPKGVTIEDVTFTLSNLTSLDDAVATRSIVIAGDALPGNYTFFTGVDMEVLFPVDFSAIPGFSVTIDIDLPGDVKNAIKLFRNTGAGWTEVTATTTGNGIVSTDFSNSNRITVKVNILQNQSFAIGAQLDQSSQTVSSYPFVNGPVLNTTNAAMSVSEMNYTAKSTGVVLTNLTKGAMVDYLRKVVMRYYRIRAINEAQDETRTYVFKPTYSLAAGGQLYIAGFQSVNISTFSIINGTSSFKAEEYGDVFAYPYAIVPTTAPTHGGGSND